jgi:hypothetical protein
MLHLQVAHEVEQLTAPQRRAKEPAGNLRQLMGFVNDEAVRAGEDLPESLILEREVGTQQMVVNHHQVGFLSPTPRRKHVAAIPLGAPLAEAIVCRGRDPGPDRGILRNGQLGDVAARSPDFPVPHLRQHGTQDRVPEPLLEGIRQAMQAQVIRAPLEQADARGNPEGIADQGEVTVEKLILEVACPGGD